VYIYTHTQIRKEIEITPRQKTKKGHTYTDGVKYQDGDVCPGEPLHLFCQFGHIYKNTKEKLRKTTKKGHIQI